jgi:serine/threonine-protein kinase SRPK3
MTADSTERSQELCNLQLLADYSQGNLSSKYIVQLLDCFTHQGPNGIHQCLVFELLGPSVGRVLEDYHGSGDQLEPATILRLSEQLLEGISFIHGAGLGHGGKKENRHLSDIATKPAFLLYVCD